MNLRQVFNALEHLHFAGLAIVNDGAGIADIDKPVVLTAINQVLTDLYSRFNFKCSEVIVRLIDGQTEYLIHSDYADSNQLSTEPVRWVVDSIDNPFLDDIQHIVSVTSSTEECLPMNKSVYCNSIYTPSFNLLQVSDETVKEADALSVIYKANPVLIPVNTTLDVDTITLDIPQNIFNVLILGVCMHVYAVKGGKEGYAKSLNYSAQYEREINRIELLGMYNELPESGLNFQSEGWA